MQLSERQRSVLSTFLPPCVIFLTVVLLFSRSIGNQFLPFDDALYVTDNRHVQEGLTPGSIFWAFTTNHAANWHPVTWLSHMLDVVLFGLDPRGHHATNIVFHAVNSTLVYFLCLRLSARRAGAAVIALLFAVHPLHVESVSWVSSRKDLLCAFFWLLGLFAYVRYAKAPSRRTYAAVAAAFVLSFLSKPVAVTFPVVLLMLDFWPLARFQWNGGAISRRQKLMLAAEKLPLFLLAGVFSVITVWVQRSGGAMDDFGPVSLGARVNNAFSSYAGYLAHTFWPVGLYVPYPHPGETRPVWNGVAAAGLLAALTGVLFALRRRRPLLLVGWWWFLVVSLPTLGLIQVGYQSMADRYMYLPILGPIVIAVQFMADASRALPPSPRVRAGLFAGIVSGLCALTWAQQAYWRDGHALFSHAIAIRPDNVPARVELAVVHLMAAEPEAAERQLRLALKSDAVSAQAWSNLGSALRMQGEEREAEDAFRQAIALEPEAYAPLVNLAALLGGSGRVDEAIALLERAVQSREEAGQGYLLLADFYVMRGDSEKAQRAREEAAKRLASAA
jgi:cytochrome c-type biogenesis protein CcmH/NrfG